MLKIYRKIAVAYLVLFAISFSVFAKEIVIYHTNDIHSRVYSTKDNIGYAKIATIVNESRSKKIPTLLLDAGDAFHGMLFANLNKGSTIVDIMSMLKYDAMAAGNHDFNYGQDRLKVLVKQAKYPIISSNVAYDSEGKNLFLKPYIVKMVGGVKVGILGLTTPETAVKTHPAGIIGLHFLDTIPQAQKYVDILRQKEKVSVVIIVSHVGVDKSSVDRSDLIAKNVTGVDVIIDGHSHTRLDNGILVNDVLIAQTGSYGNTLGMVTLDVEKGKVVSKSAKLISDFENVKPDAKVAKYIEVKDAIIQAENSKVIATTNVDWDGSRDKVRTRPTNLGNLIATSMLASSGADVAIMNGGGIRTSINKGNVTQGDVISVLPFSNILMVVKVKGSVILQALENGLSAYPESLGGYPHVAGITVEFDSSKPKGSKVVNVVLDNGSKLNPETMYSLAINDFLKAGGDGYSMFKDANITSEAEALDMMFVDYFKSGKADAVDSMKLNRIVDISKK